jgi:DNA-binding NarL/FixJ family response regulator
MEENLIRVLIADDTAIGLEGIKSILRTAEKEIRVIGETDSIVSVTRLVRELSPDILIIDLRWYGDESAGWIKIREVKEQDPNQKVIAVTAYEKLIPDARKSGADEVITKNFRREDLINLIRELAARDTSRKPESVNLAPTQDLLSPREIEVLELLATGLSDKEIADALNISVNTVKNHDKSILQKLHVENRFKAVIKAREYGILK